ncbi:twin-arginine translocase subunit TatC [Priestia megaterium]|uniref:twin-arginine translocase subunit TatC n=1 Tax=Priestia megaterium TaxID=1404 RepID=UPI003A7FD60C
MDDKQFSLTHHFNELRMRLIFILIMVVMTFAVGMFVAKPTMIYLQHAGVGKSITMNAFQVTDPFQVYIQLAFVIGLILVSPFFFYQIWAFVKPGLYETEQKITLFYIPVIVLLFLIGLVFSYTIVFPFTFKFMYQLNNDLKIHNTIGILEYFRFLLQMTLPFGFLFQMPLLTMFLTRIMLITPALLKKSRKYAYFIMLIVAAVIAPPEMMTHLLITCPLIVLYEISIVISTITYRNMAKSEGNHLAKI